MLLRENGCRIFGNYHYIVITFSLKRLCICFIVANKSPAIIKALARRVQRIPGLWYYLRGFNNHNQFALFRCFTSHNRGCFA